MPADAKLVADWIGLQSASRNSADHERLFWAFEAARDLTHEFPDAAWPFILAVLNADSSRIILQNLSAGPMEDLLAYHGEAVIDRVELEAKRNPPFATLLGGVWRNRISEEIWRRVQAVWDHRGWDGL